MIDQEPNFKKHLHLRGEIKGLQRTDIYELPEAALRETLNWAGSGNWQSSIRYHIG